MNKLFILFKAILSLFLSSLKWVTIGIVIISIIVGMCYLSESEKAQTVFGYIFAIIMLIIIVFSIIWLIIDKYNELIKKSNLPEDEYEVEFKKIQYYKVKVKAKNKYLAKYEVFYLDTDELRPLNYVKKISKVKKI